MADKKEKSFGDMYRPPMILKAGSGDEMTPITNKINQALEGTRGVTDRVEATELSKFLYGIKEHVKETELNLRKYWDLYYDEIKCRCCDEGDEHADCTCTDEHKGRIAELKAGLEENDSILANLRRVVMDRLTLGDEEWTAAALGDELDDLKGKLEEAQKFANRGELEGICKENGELKEELKAISDAIPDHFVKGSFAVEGVQGMAKEIERLGNEIIKATNSLISRDADIGELGATVAYYEAALYFDGIKPYAVKGGKDALEIDTEKVTENIRERDDLKERIVEVEDERTWVRKKLGVPLANKVGSVQGELHVLVSAAEGYENYIAAYKCDDKQGEIARQSVTIKKLEGGRDRHIEMRRKYDIMKNDLGPVLESIRKSQAIMGGDDEKDWAIQRLGNILGVGINNVEDMATKGMALGLHIAPQDADKFKEMGARMAIGCRILTFDPDLQAGTLTVSGLTTTEDALKEDDVDEDQVQPDDDPDRGEEALYPEDKDPDLDIPNDEPIPEDDPTPPDHRDEEPGPDEEGAKLSDCSCRNPDGTPFKHDGSCGGEEGKEVG